MIAAEKYFKIAYYSKINFPVGKGLFQESINMKGEPPIIKDEKIVFKITQIFSMVGLYTNVETEVFKGEFNYEIPTTDIVLKEDIHAIYTHSFETLFKVLNDLEKQNGNPPLTVAPAPPLEFHQARIDYVWHVVLGR